jgi:hypothetical protein
MGSRARRGRDSRLHATQTFSQGEGRKIGNVPGQDFSQFNFKIAAAIRLCVKPVLDQRA